MCNGSYHGVTCYLFGFSKFDRVGPPGVGFVKGKRASGYFTLADLDGNVLHARAKVSTLKRLAARFTTRGEQIRVADRLDRREKAKAAAQAQRTGNAPRSSSITPPPARGGLSRIF